MLQRFLAVRSSEVTGRGAEQAKLREPQSPHTPTTPLRSSCVSPLPPPPPHSLNGEGEDGRQGAVVAGSRQAGQGFCRQEECGGGQQEPEESA